MRERELPNEITSCAAQSTDNDNKMVWWIKSSVIILLRKTCHKDTS